jgi:hypothetical protein
MRNGTNIWSRGVKIATVLVCVAVFMGAVGCASQTGETAPKKPGGGCLSFLQLFS